MSDVATPVPPPAAIGEPGTAPEAVKKEKKTKSLYPGLINDAGERVTLNAVPTDYDVKVHTLLKKKDFTTEDVFLDFQAHQLETKAAGLRAQAEKFRKLGNSASSGKLKTLLKMQERMAELMASLRAAGVDVDNLGQVEG